MARLARVVAPGYPHHITQRGNRRQQTFFEPSDYRFYLSLLREQCEKAQVQIWAYCLMPNHVHLVAVPATEDGLKEAIGETHRRYSTAINQRMGWRGFLWQGRFGSSPMDETYLLATVRYVERNPVEAGLVESPADYPWSSAGYHLGDRTTDPVACGSPLMEMVNDWKAFLRIPSKDKLAKQLEKAQRTGRPLGNEQFIQTLEKQLNRNLQRKKPGPKPIKEIRGHDT